VRVGIGQTSTFVGITEHTLDFGGRDFVEMTSGIMDRFPCKWVSWFSKHLGRL
jgi:hypothetical protein